MPARRSPLRPPLPSRPHVSTCLQYGNGSLRLTTRQTFQLHGVLKQNLKTVFSTVSSRRGEGGT